MSPDTMAILKELREELRTLELRATQRQAAYDAMIRPLPVDGADGHRNLRPTWPWRRCSPTSLENSKETHNDARQRA